MTTMTALDTEGLSASNATEQHEVEHEHDATEMPRRRLR